MKAVVDASFLLTLLPSDPKAAALQAVYPSLRRRFELAAPALLRYETGNAIHGRHRAAIGRDVRQRRRLHALLLEGIELRPLPHQRSDRIGDVAERYGLTYYDAAYLSEALRADEVVLLTEDRRLHAAATEALGAPWVWDVDVAVREARA